MVNYIRYESVIVIVGKEFAPAWFQPSEAWLFLIGGKANMTNSLERQKDIASLKKRFSIIARSPPRFDPFTFEGREAYEAWGDTCRGLESELREAGVQL